MTVYHYICAVREDISYFRCRECRKKKRKQCYFYVFKYELTWNGVNAAKAFPSEMFTLARWSRWWRGLSGLLCTSLCPISSPLLSAHVRPTSDQTYGLAGWSCGPGWLTGCCVRLLLSPSRAPGVVLLTLLAPTCMPTFSLLVLRVWIDGGSRKKPKFPRWWLNYTRCGSPGESGEGHGLGGCELYGLEDVI